MPFGKNKVGRPKKNDKRDGRIDVRLSEKELDKLVTLMDYKGVSASEAVRFAIDLAHNFIV